MNYNQRSQRILNLRVLAHLFDHQLQMTAPKAAIIPPKKSIVNADHSERNRGAGVQEKSSSPLYIP